MGRMTAVMKQSDMFGRDIANHRFLIASYQADTRQPNEDGGNLDDVLYYLAVFRAMMDSDMASQAADYELFISVIEELQSAVWSAEADSRVTDEALTDVSHKIAKIQNLMFAYREIKDSKGMISLYSSTRAIIRYEVDSICEIVHACLISKFRFARLLDEFGNYVKQRDFVNGGFAGE